MLYRHSYVAAGGRRCARVRFRISAQSGQALLLGIGLLVLCLSAWLLMHQVGSWVHNKSALHRATDAAAYSAALAYARNLNLHAYLNRTQLAHQVAQLHLFSLAAAESFRTRLARQASARNPPAALIGYRFGLQHAAAYLAADRGRLTDGYTLTALRDAFARHDQLIHEVLQQSRKSRMETSSEINEVLNNILTLNIGQSGSGDRGTSLEALGMRYRILHSDMERFLVINRTSDDNWFNMLQEIRARFKYFDDRRIVVRSFNGINLRCPWMQHQLRRRGSLEISRFGDWRSEENLSFHNLRFNRYIGCYFREYPMGWAKIQLSESGPTTTELHDRPLQTFKSKPFWKWAGERAWTGWNLFGGTRNPLAERWADQNSLKWRTRGQATYANLNPDFRGDTARIAIEVEQRWRTYPRLRSTAAAEAYFLFPERRHAGHSEQPSLFKPFWLARLVPVSLIQTRSTDRLWVSK